MKAILIISYLLVVNGIHSQPIPLGISSDSLIINTPPNTTLYEGTYNIYYYKPANYDSINSPILWYVHGTGGTGVEGTTALSAMADKKNALIISPTMHVGSSGWAYVADIYYDSITDCLHLMWSSEIFKQIYRHVLQRENRDSVPVYLTGFSQGGQFVSRYMLVRQFAPDSIPISMAVSISAANYTLCTDTLRLCTLSNPCCCTLSPRAELIMCASPLAIVASQILIATASLYKERGQERQTELIRY